MTKLSSIPPGTKVRVKAIVGRGSLFQRLLEMGLVPGTVLEMVRRAPLGDPLEIRLHHFNLSLRVAEADRVEVAHV